MRDTMTLRDHNESCGHDEAFEENGRWYCYDPSRNYGGCPGGKTITLRRPDYIEIWERMGKRDDVWVEVDNA